MKTLMHSNCDSLVMYWPVKVRGANCGTTLISVSIRLYTVVAQVELEKKIR